MSEIAQIQSTTDYSKFKFMTGNRLVDKSNVRRLKDGMIRYPDLFPTQPILVNANMFIIDGQHRFEAAKDLDLPVYYVVNDAATISTARHMNVTQRSWTIMDFARSYAEGGNKNYEQFLHMTKKFPSIPASIIILYMEGDEKHRLNNLFREGLFNIEDIDESLDNLEKLNTVRYKTGCFINKPMALALLRLFKSDEKDIDFDWNKFDKKLDNEHALKLFTIATTVKGCLRIIEEVYNFQSQYRTRLY